MSSCYLPEGCPLNCDESYVGTRSPQFGSVLVKPCSWFNLAVFIKLGLMWSKLRVARRWEKNYSTSQNEHFPNLDPDHQFIPFCNLPYSRWWQLHYSSFSGWNIGTIFDFCLSHSTSNPSANTVISSFKTYQKSNHFLSPPLWPSWSKSSISLFWITLPAFLGLAPSCLFSSGPENSHENKVTIYICPKPSNDFPSHSQQSQVLSVACEALLGLSDSSPAAFPVLTILMSWTRVIHILLQGLCTYCSDNQECSSTRYKQGSLPYLL